ncbi:DNA gyrase subunit A [Pseudomonas gingeri NCPPB 3146 = LMG 5327]|uniref:DNA gyrase subunit A n=2 Tax=Pseudomonas gingeri TaxID=117681 RepID=A0A7Y7XTK3_9PSED|nr:MULTISPECIES: DNA gyrase subunit A [Pseudomonas]NWA09355.1 DNA gyrase subunit A [Pseudomonas gingeri]NWC12077.1 DNA gyrase subunit A [Pseudomonas gingeri]NWE47927.1 DNA gyrase subunit A [Pseudomonas gingeri]NWE68444.1 DNA gyrase subunit A [Pseudomonas gingeri]PNQ94621.1 DNA gyrase subunit A [Pseudomonas gingeri NCPPB 3146 = LMG 5327]
MGELAKEILPVNIEDELKQSYLDYAMSVIVGRALPDARDGLKPVHRRVLFAMSELGNDWNKPYKKSARVVGDVIGKYHPHGDTAVYDTIVRMAQPFSLRYLLVDGQGNFGSVDGDNAAAMRYTEVRMTKLAHELLADLHKETVDWVPNYDGTEQIPAVMPTRIPNLLVNGSSGIAVGMATNIPPHNLGEVIDGCLALIDNPELTVDELMQFIPGPDFPTAAIINGRAGIIEAYRTGRGRIYMRARSTVEDIDKVGGRQQIVITELPYQLNKARLIEKIAELVKEKKLEGITELRDESDKDGMRVVIELRRGEVPEVILNNLYAQTQLQSVFGINIVALIDGRPRILNLKDLLEAFVRHRREVVTRRTVFELRKARERGHILEGQAVALSNIDPVIALIKASPTPSEAKEALISTPWESSAVMTMVERAGADSCRPENLDPQYGLRDGKYFLSPEQAQAILELRLHRLTGLEHEKLLAEYQEILNQIGELIRILNSATRLMEVIREELEVIRAEYGDARRTEILDARLDLTLGDMIPEEERVVTISHSGYAKTQPLSAYQAQRRGGKGKSATGVKDEDYISHLLVANSHATLLLFSSKGKVYWLKTYEIPEASRAARGRPLVNLLPLDEGEYITTMLQIDLEALQQSAGADDDLDDADDAVIEGEVIEADEAADAAEEVDGDTAELVAEPTGAYIFMATAFGTVKKTPLAQFSRPRSSGLIALKLKEGDTLIAAAITDGAKEVMLFSNAGKVIRFAESVVREMGRGARGIRGMRIGKGQQLISMLIPESGAQILTASERGFGKRTPLSKFPRRGRGGQGVIAMVTKDRNGQLIGAIQVQEGEEIMLISDQGTLVRTRVDEVSSLGRNTQGVTLIKLASDETLVGLERVQEPSEVEGEDLESEEGVEFGGEVMIDGVADDSSLDAAADEVEPQD